MPPYKYKKLRGRIRERCSTQRAFAAEMGFTASTLSTKLNGRSQWSSDEIVRACGVLGIPIAEAPAYFFAE